MAPAELQSSLTLEDPGANSLREAHTRLDTAVRTACGMPTNAAPLAFLPSLHLAFDEKEKSGEELTPPWLAHAGSECTAFITEDCIRMAEPGGVP